MNILVTGATGSVGRHLTRLLSEQGHAVRALTRTPGKTDLPPAVEVVAGDLSDPTTLGAHLFESVQQVFVFPAEGGVDALVQAAVENGVRRMVVLSSLAAAGEHPRDIGSASYVHHRAVEVSVADRTPDWTFLRPGTFANNLLSWAFAVKSGQPIRAPYLDSAQAPIHELDVAEAAAHVLTNDGYTGQAIALTGPQALNRREQVQTIAEAIGHPIQVQEISAEEFRAEFGQWIPAEITTMLLEYWSDTVAEPDVPNSVEAVTGRPGRTLAQWAADHRGDFTG